MSCVEVKVVCGPAAHAGITAAIAVSQRLGIATAIAIIGRDGVLKAFQHMDGSPLPSVTLAQDTC